MNYFKENRWVYWTIAILVVLNLFTVSMLWMQNSRQGEYRNGIDRPGLRSERKKGRMAKELNLTEDQSIQFKAFKEAHKKEVGATVRAIKEKKKNKMDALTATPSDTNTVNQLDREIGLLHVEMEKSLTNHYHDLSAICNDEQKEKIKKRFRKSFQKEPRGDRKRPNR